MNPVDTVFVLLSAALVMLMTPGLALFYGGMVRRKNILSVLIQCFAAMCVLNVWWVLVGYSLSFCPSNGFWGGLGWLGLKGVGYAPMPDYSSTVPNRVFMIFQAMFAVITPALIIGAFAERMKFSAYIVFTLLWATFVYAPVCHWVWGSGGWLKQRGVLDFAGGIVVHATAGVAALVTTIVIGKRRNLFHSPAPHNLPLVVLGTGLLWFGWFGFNAGSALGVNEVAVNAFITTNTAAATAGLVWTLLEWIRNGRPTVFGVITGCVAGLATITPGAGFVSVGSSMIIGAFASILCFIAVAIIKPKYGYDDSLDVFGVHGVGGILGVVCVGLFATKSVNTSGADGLFYGNPQLLITQLTGLLAVILYTTAVTFIICKFVNIFLGVRIGEQDESIGLDLAQHRENAYTLLE
ncbi:MAG: ammonium transporter [Candidatus Omnitrophica bacterium]|nr:ammonium transporter [Candidatus Omnitrophota bacterium]MDE2222866.1 ammonium transporter [Candidatus Omnitrophota bacterium]